VRHNIETALPTVPFGIAGLFGYEPRSAALLCQRWVERAFLETTEPAKKSSRYKLGDLYATIVDEID